MFELHVVMCGSKIGHKKHVFQKTWSMCSKFVKHSKFNKEHKWRDPFDHHLSRKTIFTKK